MRVDFYQLGSDPAESVIASIAGKLVEEGQRLLIVGRDEAQLARLDRQLWDHGPTSFLPHGLAGEGDDAAQPILLSTGTDSPNRARNLLIADGQWRDAALGYERAFFLFDAAGIEGAREAWKSLADRPEVTRNYWAFSDGKWDRRG